MIIADALKGIIDQKTVNVLNKNNQTVSMAINFHYGDQKELLRWVKLKNNAKKVKYPLVWYIFNEFTELDGFYSTDVTFAIMQINEDLNALNDKRTAISYVNVINPVFEKVKELLFESGKIEVFGKSYQTLFTQRDEPNFGVDINNQDYKSSDFKSVKQIGTQSIVTDIVDAKFVNLKMRINLNNC